MNSRKSYIEIDLGQLNKNYEYMKRIKGKEIIPVIKADAYGHGAVEIAKSLEKKEVKYFAVAFLEEAIILRKSGIKSDLIMFNYMNSEYLEKVIENRVSLTIYDCEQIKEYYLVIGNRISEISFHININTGMNRSGIDEAEIMDLIALIKNYNLKIDGVYSHYKDAGNDSEYSKIQYERFENIINTFEGNGIRGFKKYISNSAGAIFEEDKCDYIKPGMALYGLQAIKREKIEEIKNILTLKSIVSKIRKVKKGEYIGYGTSYKAKEDIYAGTVPIGYSDGYKIALSNKADVLINGKRYRILGEVSMDQIVVGVDESVALGNEVVLIGKQGNDEIKIEELGSIAGTIPDDIVCSLSMGISRIYND